MSTTGPNPSQSFTTSHRGGRGGRQWRQNGRPPGNSSSYNNEEPSSARRSQGSPSSQNGEPSARRTQGSASENWRQREESETSGTGNERDKLRSNNSYRGRRKTVQRQTGDSEYKPIFSPIFQRKETSHHVNFVHCPTNEGRVVAQCAVETVCPSSDSRWWGRPDFVPESALDRNEFVVPQCAAFEVEDRSHRPSTSHHPSIRHDRWTDSETEADGLGDKSSGRVVKVFNVRTPPSHTKGGGGMKTVEEEERIRGSTVRNEKKEEKWRRNRQRRNNEKTYNGGRWTTATDGREEKDGSGMKREEQEGEEWKERVQEVRRSVVFVPWSPAGKGMERRSLEEVVRSVYHNDLLMTHIVANITNLSDRCSVEMSSDRLYQISKRAPYRFATGGDHLSIYFSTYDDNATIELGTVIRYVPVLTLATRRYDNMASRMTPQLETILNGIGTRFARHVKKLSLGGTPDFYAQRGVAAHQMMITADLLECLISIFPSVTSLTLTRCGFDDSAVVYCRSDRFASFASRLHEVKWQSVWADTRESIRDVADCVLTDSLQRLEVSMFTTGMLGPALLKCLGKPRNRLDFVRLTVDEGTASDEADLYQLLMKVSARTDALAVTVVPAGDGATPPDTVFRTLRDVWRLQNITEFRLKVKPYSRDHYFLLLDFFKNLSSFRGLRVFHCLGVKDVVHQSKVRQLATYMEHALRNLPHLEELRLANFPLGQRPRPNWGEKERAYDDLACCVAGAIPSTVRVLELRSMHFNDNLMAQVYQNCPLLEEVKLADLRRTTAQAAIVPLISGDFPAISKVDSELALNVCSAWKLADVADTPKLEMARLGLRQEVKEEDTLIVELRKLFKSVFINVEGPKGYCKKFLEVHRRVPGAVAPPRELIERAKAECGGQVRHPVCKPAKMKHYEEWSD